MLGYKLETEYNLMQNKQKMKMLIAIPLGLLLFIGILLSQVLVPNSNPPAVADTTNTSEESSTGSANDGNQPVETTNPIIENIVQEEQGATTTENSTNSNSGETSQSSTPTKGTDGGNTNTNPTVQDGNGGSNTNNIIGNFGGGGGGGHHSSNSNNNNSGNGDGTENGNNNNSQPPQPQFWIKVADTNVVGNPVTSYILTTYSGPGVALFGAFHEPDCSVDSNDPCELMSDNSVSSPTYAGEIPAACEPCYEYQVTFSPDTFVKGENHITAVVINGDEVIGTAETDFTVQSLFVVPESPIGIIGLMISAIAGIAVYLKLASRTKMPSLT